MADHLQYRGTDVETYTPHGDWLAELLHLAERRGLREFILSALGKFLTVRSELLSDLTAYEGRIEDAGIGVETSSLQTAIRETAEELQRVDRQIELLTGERVSRR